MSQKMANLSIPGAGDFQLPVLEGTEGEVGLDISNLRAESKAITLDIGYVNTGSCTSEITFINGEQGILRYRGYSIEQLCEKSNFTEVSYLLLFGALPTTSQLEKFESEIKKYSAVPSEIENMTRLFPKTAHPMGVLSSGMAALSGFYDDLLKGTLSDAEKERVFAQLMGQMKIIISSFYRHIKGQQSLKSESKLGYAEDFVHLMFGDGSAAVDEDVAKILDLLLILHADHEQNCSASTVRMVGSSKANLFATVSAGVDALWGPLHGGANQKVIEMLDAIQADGGDYKKYLEKAKDKNDPFRLNGFGHRVYKNFDPRARIIKKSCDVVLAKLGVKDPVLDIAKGLEEAALSDPYFAERKLYPNVDFYSGIIYRALGIPTNMFTAMFALGRLPGWMAQWREMIEVPSLKICRPRQIYMGANERPYVDISQR